MHHQCWTKANDRLDNLILMQGAIAKGLQTECEVKSRDVVQTLALEVSVG